MDAKTKRQMIAYIGTVYNKLVGVCYLVRVPVAGYIPHDNLVAFFDLLAVEDSVLRG